MRQRFDDEEPPTTAPRQKRPTTRFRGKESIRYTKPRGYTTPPSEYRLQERRETRPIPSRSAARLRDLVDEYSRTAGLPRPVGFFGQLEVWLPQPKTWVDIFYPRRNAVIEYNGPIHLLHYSKDLSTAGRIRASGYHLRVVDYRELEQDASGTAKAAYDWLASLPLLPTTSQ